jgi:hypothetical protein
MPAKYQWQLKKQDLSVADFELRADTNEGYIIHEIGCEGGAGNLVLTVKIKERTMTGLPADSGKAECLPVPLKSTNNNTFFKMLRERYDFIPEYRVAPGDKFIISSGGNAGTAYVVYSHFIDEDLPAATEAGGRLAPERLVVSVGKGELSIGAGETKEFVVNTSLNPTGIDAFPYGVSCPADRDIDILGFSTCLGDGAGANINYDGIRIVYKEEEVLSPDWEYTIPEMFPFNRPDLDKPVFFFPKGFEVVPGEKFEFQVKCSNTGAAAETAQVIVAVYTWQKPRG